MDVGRPRHGLESSEAEVQTRFEVRPIRETKLALNELKDMVVGILSDHDLIKTESK
mgnify:CR=1 FL=1